MQRMILLDIIVPSYRVDLKTLSRILSLKPSANCTTTFITIVDDPHSPAISELKQSYSRRRDVRILVNKSNLGASASRNRGLVTSSAEWVAFLDDDVIPASDYLIQAEHAIRARPHAAGFVGNTYFPPPSNIFTTAIHLSGVTYFWNIADKIKDDIPWGVTANLIVRHDTTHGVWFDTSFPKLGGGEDIDFCRRKRQVSIERGGIGFCGAPKVVAVHPWWNEGQRSYWRFFRWAMGDGALVKMHPKLAWRDWSPNSAELLLFSLPLLLSGAGLRFWGYGSTLKKIGLALPMSTIVVNMANDAYSHSVRGSAESSFVQASTSRLGWYIASSEGTLIRMTNEMGRLVGILKRQEWTCVGRRFDWFAGGPGSITPERTGNLRRFLFTCALTGIVAMH